MITILQKRINIFKAYISYKKKKDKKDKKR